MATIYALKKEYHAAIDIYETLVNSLSKLPELKNNLAVCLLGIDKQNKRSIKLIQKALSEKKGILTPIITLKLLAKKISKLLNLN